MLASFYKKKDGSCRFQFGGKSMGDFIKLIVSEFERIRSR
jgi:hypothetical protein